MNFKELRQRAGLTQVEVAKKLNVDQGAISHWEAGINMPPRKHYKMLAKLYGVTIEELECERKRRRENAKIKKNA